MFKVFTDGQVSPDDMKTLSALEEQLFLALLARKFLKPKIQLDISDSVEGKAQRINQFLMQKSPKRPEECYKFILTRALKYLRKAQA